MHAENLFNENCVQFDVLGVLHYYLLLCRSTLIELKIEVNGGAHHHSPTPHGVESSRFPHSHGATGQPLYFSIFHFLIWKKKENTRPSSPLLINWMWIFVRSQRFPSRVLLLWLLSLGIYQSITSVSRFHPAFFFFFFICPHKIKNAWLQAR